MSITLMKLVARTMFSKAISNFSLRAINTRTHIREGNRAVFNEELYNRRSSRQFIERSDD